AGQLSVNANIRGKLDAPDFDGRVSLGSLVINGADTGTLTASLVANATEFRINDGRLTERDGGSLQFSINGPRNLEKNISVDATLDRTNAVLLMTALPLSKDVKERLSDTQSAVSG